MAQGTAPAASEILVILRVVRRWKPEEVAASSGLTVRSVHAYERGERGPDAATMRRLAVAMGFPAAALGRAAAFVARTRASLGDAEVAMVAGRGEESRCAWIGTIAAEAGQWFEDRARAGLQGALLGAAAGGAHGPGLPRGAARPLGEALTILRLVRDVTQTELGAVSGIKANAISSYERGRALPRPEDVRRLVEGMGFTAAALERAVAFVEGLRAAASGPEPPASEGALVAQIDQLAVEEGRAAEEFTRARLLRMTLQVRVLASRRGAPALWQRLAGRSRSEQRRLVGEDAGFHTSGFCELLCEESVRAAGDSAAEAVHLAELAVRVAWRAVDEERWRLRLEGYARFHLANATRVAGDLPAAERELRQAAERWAAGAGGDSGLLNEARVLSFEASLRRDQRQLPEAVALLDRALAGDRWGETTRLLIGKAKALEEMSDFDGAITLLRQAGSRADARRQPHLLFWLQNNLAVNLSNLGLHTDAELVLAEVRSLARRLGKKLDLLRLRWVEGRVAAGLGRSAEALEILEEVRSEFVSRDIAYDAALVTLEVAEVHAFLGHSAQVKRLARESAPVFFAQGVHREAQRALEYFRAAAEAESLPLDLVRAIIVYLYRARRDPHLRFEAPG
jgi:transcriptional regulator with XRE-family HTH domain